MRNTVKIQLHCLNYVRKKKNLKPYEELQINVFAMSVLHQSGMKPEFF